jgi:hypothetical protein
MTCYLLHATEKHMHVQHYIGWTQNKSTLAQRLKHHAEGNGSTFIRRVQKARKERGQEPWHLVLARVWDEGTKEDERKLKNRNGAARFCPVCQGIIKVEDCKNV